MDFKIREIRTAQGPKKLLHERETYFQLMQQGFSNNQACLIVGVNSKTGRRWRNGRNADRKQKAAPPVRPVVPPSGPSRYLREDERIYIADRLREKAGVRQIAAELDRSPSTISREIRRNRTVGTRGLWHYRPHAAQARADTRRPRPKPGPGSRRQGQYPGPASGRPPGARPDVRRIAQWLGQLDGEPSMPDQMQGVGSGDHRQPCGLHHLPEGQRILCCDGGQQLVLEPERILNRPPLGRQSVQHRPHVRPPAGHNRIAPTTGRCPLVGRGEFQLISLADQRPRSHIQQPPAAISRDGQEVGSVLRPSLSVLEGQPERCGSTSLTRRKSRASSRCCSSSDSKPWCRPVETMNCSPGRCRCRACQPNCRTG